MSPVEPVALLGAAAQAAPSAATLPPVVPEHQIKDFEALMSRTENQVTASHLGGETKVGQLLERQAEEVARTEASIHQLMVAAPGMSSAELTAASMALSRRISVEGFHMTVATSITQGANKSLQTLLKNQ